MIQAARARDGALRLHRHLLERHWDGKTLSGPDPGIRFNVRFGRFLKSYFDRISWSDDMVYMQAQGYWVSSNWLLADFEDDEDYADLAVACSNEILALQTNEGYWEYPNPEWKDRIATVEGCFAGLALLSTYGRTKRDEMLQGALKWQEYVEREVGFRDNPRGLAVQYFAANEGHGGGVPNNSTLYCWFLAELADATDDDAFLGRAHQMLEWLADVQLPTGELPYRVGDPGQTHFLCYQYNAFEFVDLVHYLRLTGDQSVLEILGPLAGYLAEGVRPDGGARYECGVDHPTVTYYASALGQALREATTLGLGDYGEQAELAYEWVLSNQKPDGSLAFHSTDNYRFFSDRRSYPRYSSMVLHHLLLEAQRSSSTTEAGV